MNKGEEVVCRGETINRALEQLLATREARQDSSAFDNARALASLRNFKVQSTHILYLRQSHLFEAGLS